MDADGSNSVNLSNNPATDALVHFSPVGLRIAFETNRDDSEVYLMNADAAVKLA